MSQEREGHAVQTVLRGAPLRQANEAAAAKFVACAPSTTSTAAPNATGKLINGVPASAAMHCCGRGCAHCRIYWRKSEL